MFYLLLAKASKQITATVGRWGPRPQRSSSFWWRASGKATRPQGWESSFTVSSRLEKERKMGLISRQVISIKAHSRGKRVLCEKCGHLHSPWDSSRTHHHSLMPHVGSLGEQGSKGSSEVQMEGVKAVLWRIISAWQRPGGDHDVSTGLPEICVADLAVRVTGIKEGEHSSGGEHWSWE